MVASFRLTSGLLSSGAPLGSALCAPDPFMEIVLVYFRAVPPVESVTVMTNVPVGSLVGGV